MSNVPECYDGIEGPCVVEHGSKGGVIYTDYQACSQSDILLPGFDLLPDWFLAVVYGLTLIWAFFGVAIISDIFMASIETITSLEKEVVKKDKKTGETFTITVTVWNATVANLTLMALGSSAPEILLAVVETITDLGEPAGELGPSTIVGSAAFNLLIITAICIVAVPEGQVKRITEYGVFLWTSFVSVFAYFWMLVVYKFWTPDEITIAEAWITLAYLPIFVGAAYLLDAKPWLPKEAPERITDPYHVVIGARGTDEEGHAYSLNKGQVQSHIRAAHLSSRPSNVSAAGAASVDSKDAAGSPETSSPMAGGGALITGPPSDHRGGGDPALSDLVRVTSTRVSGSRSARPSSAVSPDDITLRIRQLRAVAEETGEGSELSEEQLAQIAKDLTSGETKPLTALQYKMNARNALTGRSHYLVAHREEPTSGSGDLRRISAPPKVDVARTCKIMFASEEYRVLESQRVVRIMVHCDRAADAFDTVIQVAYRTRNGTAVGGWADDDGDFVHQNGVLTFEPGVRSKAIEIIINEDDEVEEDETFSVELFDPQPAHAHIQRPKCRVTIVDTTEAGYLVFEEAVHVVAETQDFAVLNMLRKGGAAGTLLANFRTQSDTAVQDIDYKHTEGTVVFEAGECKKAITVELGPGREAGRSFMLYLTEHPSLSTKANNPTVSKKKGMCKVEIAEDAQVGTIQAMMEGLVRRHSPEAASSHWADWKDQFREAVMPGPGVGDDGEEQEITASTIVLHYVSITWKLIFAFVPPPDMWSGGPTFVISLAMIGGLTYFIGPIASMFGCAIGLSEGMTAIVFVALGTSLPDTFASYQAANESADADAAIGNVTGSNAVNVFLGLGLPWVIATAYSLAKDETYVTPAGPLSFSVTVFMGCAVLCLLLLLIKRRRGGELGGTGFGRKGAAAFLVFLWLLYLLLSGLQSKGHIDWDG